TGRTPIRRIPQMLPMDRRATTTISTMCEFPQSGGMAEELMRPDSAVSLMLTLLPICRVYAVSLIYALEPSAQLIRGQI
ncbi:unnamed protein product, partial [Mycena citricolor]